MNLPKLTQRHGVGKCSWKNDTSKGFPCGSVGKESTCNILTWLGRSPGGGHGSPLQYSFLENPMERGAWWAVVHRVAQSQTWLKQLSSGSMYLPTLLPAYELTLLYLRFY